LDPDPLARGKDPDPHQNVKDPQHFEETAGLPPGPVFRIWIPDPVPWITDPDLDPEPDPMILSSVTFKVPIKNEHIF
jgi:hypothetical protein